MLVTPEESGVVIPDAPSDVAPRSYRAPMEVRLMIPASRLALPRWEVSVDGEVVGWIQESKIGRSTVTFYKALGVHPETGRHVNLENSTDLDERVRVLLDFHENPERFKRHVY
jgi:hypothetical protein